MLTAAVHMLLIFFDSGGEFVELVAVEGVTESKAIVGLVGG